MNTSPKHRQLISRLLLVCSVVSLLLYLQMKYWATPPGVGGQSAIQIYERLTGGVLEGWSFWHFGSLVPAILVLTAALAAWNFRLCRRQA
jgi:hypothetical protein